MTAPGEIPMTVWVELRGWKLPRKDYNPRWHQLACNFLRDPSFFSLDNSQRLLWVGLHAAAAEAKSALVQIDLPIYAAYAKGTVDLMWSALKHFEQLERVRIFFAKPTSEANPLTPGAAVTDPVRNPDEGRTDPERNPPESRNENSTDPEREPDESRTENVTLERELELERELQVENSLLETRERENARARVDRLGPAEVAPCVAAVLAGAQVVNLASSRTTKPAKGPPPGRPYEAGKGEVQYVPEGAPDPDELVKIAARKIADVVKSYSPDAAAEDVDAWAEVLREIRDGEGVAVEEIASVAGFALVHLPSGAKPDTFWREKVLAPDGFRKSWKTMLGQKRAHRPKAGGYRG